MKRLLYILYLLIITFVILEVAVRFLSKENPAHVELFLNKKHRYLLPLPSDSARFYEGSIQADDHDGYRVFDDTLGWSHRPWGKELKNFPCYGNDRGLRIDSASYAHRDRALKHYDILTIGDSFTHGDAVAAEDSWPYLLAQQSGKSVGNLGVGGYGLQQALMRFMFSGITADTVLFGAIWGDFERAREPVYTFYQGGNKTRPLFHFKEGGGYDLVNVPVMKPIEFYRAKAAHTAPIFEHIPGFGPSVFSRAFWTKSYFLRLLVSLKQQKAAYREKPIYLSDDGDLEHCIQIFELFAQYCAERGMYSKVILLDTGQNFGHKEQFGLDNPWWLVAEKLSARNIDFSEFHQPLYRAFKNDRNSLIHPIENLHYSPAGNQLVCDLLLRDLNLN